jgi:probable HAF family extracellular repeat protein
MKRITKHWLTIAVVAALLMAIPSTRVNAAADSVKGYTFETIDPPSELLQGENFTVEVVFINNVGLITMQWQSPISANFWDNVHSAVVQKGHWTTLDVPGYANAAGSNANSQGEIAVGYYGLGDYAFKNMIYWRGDYTPFEFRGMGSDRYVMVDSINEREQFAAAVFDGTTNAENMVGHGLVGTSSRYTIFDYPAAVNTIAMGINNDETVVGWYQDSNNSTHAFLYDYDHPGSAFANIDVPGSTASYATAINNSGEIAGAYIDQNGNIKGYLLRGSQYTDFVVPGAVWTDLYWINDLGQISGIYLDKNGIWHGFVATPEHSSK